MGNNYFPFTVPNPGPIESMDIYGFSTEDLHKALTIKLREDTRNFYVGEMIPELLEQLHVEMANNITTVS